MAVQLPEPDYYTPEELAERWGISKAILFRLAREGKVTMGFITSLNFRLAVYGTWEDENGKLCEGEVPGRMYGFPRDTFLPMGGVLLESSDLRTEDCLSEGAGFIPSVMEPWPYRTFFNIEGLPRKDWFLVIPSSVKDQERYRIYYKNIVIPTYEIHRIERQHEAAEQAAADDPLNTKEKETLEGIIAAMATMIAKTAPLLRCGDKPNASQIAQAILDLNITDKSKSTIRKAISKALDHFPN